jgi:hypothetical protein
MIEVLKMDLHVDWNICMTSTFPRQDESPRATKPEGQLVAFSGFWPFEDFPAAIQVWLSENTKSALHQHTH